MLNVSKAKLLQEQVGAQSGSSSVDQKMWYHANQLYEKAKTLIEQVSSQPDLTGPLDVLKKAIGENDSAPGSLQKALSELSSATGDSLIVEKAFNVVNDYNAVVAAYEKVEAQAGQYRGALAKTSGTEYEQVTNAFDALQGIFNAGKCKAITPIFDKPWIA